MIRFANGKTLPSVILSTIGGHYGSGMMPYSFDSGYNHLMGNLEGSGTAIFSKSATFNPRVGNVVMRRPWTAFQYIKRIGDRGMVNAYGLTNPGVKKCAQGIAKSIKRGYNVIPNFYPEFVKDGQERLGAAIQETLEAIRCYEFLIGDAFWAIELNFSCPNSEEEIAENMRQVLQCLTAVRRSFPGLIVIAKMSWVHPIEFFEEIAHHKLADALHCFNTIPYQLVFGAGQRSPLKNGLGGASGGPIRKPCFDQNVQVAKRVNLPIIMGGGVPVSSLDLVKPYFGIGAGAVSVCTDVAYLPCDALSLVHHYN
jgi:dihydroorotate dehydrogenase (NAD+) catalytic subunit